MAQTRSIWRAVFTQTFPASASEVPSASSASAGEVLFPGCKVRCASARLQPVPRAGPSDLRAWLVDFCPRFPLRFLNLRPRALHFFASLALRFLDFRPDFFERLARFLHAQTASAAASCAISSATSLRSIAGFGVECQELRSFLRAGSPESFRSGSGKVRVLLRFVANHSDGHTAARDGTDGVAEVAGVADGLIIDAHDHVAGAEPGLLGAAAFLHRANQHALPVLHAEEIHPAAA